MTREDRELLTAARVEVLSIIDTLQRAVDQHTALITAAGALIPMQAGRPRVLSSFEGIVSGYAEMLQLIDTRLREPDTPAPAPRQPA